MLGIIGPSLFRDASIAWSMDSQALVVEAITPRTDRHLMVVPA